MKKDNKKLVSACAAVVISVPLLITTPITSSSAGSCYSYGNSVYCSDGYSAYSYGNSWYGNDGYSSYSCLLYTSPSPRD